MYKIIVVDDEKFVRRSIINALDWDSLGLEIIAEAENGQRAIELFNQTKPDIIITDIKMPLQNGIDLIKSVKSINPDVQFIILSGYDDFEYTKEAIKLGVSNYIKKPVNEEELTDTLRLIISKLNLKQDADKNLSLLQNQAEKSKSLIYEKYLTRFIDENILDSQIDMNFCSNIFSVLFIYLANGINQTTAPENSDELLEAKLNSIMEKSGAGTFNFFIFQVRQCSNTFCILLSCNNLKNELIQKIALSLRTNILAELNREKADYKIAVAYVPVFNEIKHIPQNYVRCFKLLKCRILCEDWLLTDESKIFLNDKTFSNMIYSSIELIKQSMENRILNEISSALKKLLCNGNKGRFSLELLESLVLELGNLLRIFTLKYGENNFDQDYEALLQSNYILQFKNLDSLRNNILLHINNVFTNILKFDSKNIIDKIRNYIETNYMNDLTLTNIARDFYINPSYLSQLYKAKTGINLSTAIEDVRMENAKQLLKNLTLNVGTVATMVGYSDPNYFTKIFKARTGMLPSAYQSSKI